jgi:hypothetical protein
MSSPRVPAPRGVLSALAGHSPLRGLLRLVALASTLSLAGCISSTAPVLTEGKPLLGETVHLQLYHLRDGLAHDPATGTLRWQNGSYRTFEDGKKETSRLTLQTFDGADLIVQSTDKNNFTEYAVARKVIDGVYLVFVIDEADADEATRKQYCKANADSGCTVTTPEAVLAFARATVGKPHDSPSIALLLAVK